MNERIKLIREKLGLSQNDFAEKLSLQRNSISLIENGKRNPSERTINDICNIFNANENWLRFGHGEMFIEPNTFSLDEYAKARGMDDLEMEIVKCYLDLDPNIRKSVLEHFKSHFIGKDEEKEIERKVDSYRKSLELEAKGAEELSASNELDLKKA